MIPDLPGSKGAAKLAASLDRNALSNEQLRLHIAIVPSAVIGSIVVATFVASMLHRVIEPGVLLFWFSFLLLAGLARIGLRVLHKRRPLPDRVALSGFRLIAAIYGFIYGSISIFLFPAEPIHQSFVMVALAAVAANAFTLTAFDLMAALPIAGLSLVPLSLRLFSEGTEGSIILGFGALASLAFMFANGLRANQVVLENIALRRQEAGRADALRQEIAERRQTEVELIKARESAELAHQVKSRFLANMSHEIRSPLAAVLGSSEQALRPGQGAPAWNKALQTIQRSSRHLLSIVNDILDAAQLESGHLSIQQAEVSPLAVCEEVVELMRANAEEKSLAFELEVGWPLPKTIVADGLRLRQVLVNLVSNAIKFTDRGGVRIKLSADRANNLLEIKVIDSGIGMSPTQIERLFQPFTQGDPSNSRRFGGTGLGLYISAELLAQMAGSIKIASQPENGSVFTIELKIGSQATWLDAPQIPQPRVMTVEASEVPLQGRVLLVEDDVVLRELTTAMLEMIGVEVDVAHDGRQAIALIGQGGFDVVLMDMHMPILDGRAAVHQLRADGYPGKIVALTADLLPESVAGHCAAGCDAVLGKPATLEQLRATLAAQLAA